MTVSIVETVVIECDGCDDMIESTSTGGVRRSRRSLLHAADWFAHGGDDYCPVCVKQILCMCCGQRRPLDQFRFLESRGYHRKHCKQCESVKRTG